MKKIAERVSGIGDQTKFSVLFLVVYYSLMLIGNNVREERERKINVKAIETHVGGI